MTGLAGASGFSGGFQVLPTSGGLSSFQLHTGYTYTSGNAIVWDNQILNDPSLSYDFAGHFTANATGTYLIKMYALTSQIVGGQSMYSILNVGLTSPITMAYYGYEASYPAGGSLGFVIYAPFIYDAYLTAGQVFSFALNVVSPSTTPLAGSTTNLSTIRFIG